jgi:hypothetical protein
MPETSTAPDRMAATAVVVATLATLAVNAAAAAGLINSVTPADVSARFPTAITPAGYAFSIWTVIYLGMLAFNLYQMRAAASSRFRNIRWVYVTSCVLNCAWIIFWQYAMVAVCLVVISLLAGSLLVICYRLREPSSFVEALITKAPFGLYLGWVSCATLVNLLIFLGWIGVDPQNHALGVVLIVVATAGGFLVRWKLRNYLYPLAVAWALTAIAIEHSGNTSIVIAAAFGTVACLVTAGSVVTTLKDSTSE